jgi:hypothetical protein
MSGAHVDGTPSTIEDAQAAIIKLWEELTAQHDSSEAAMPAEDAIGWGADPEGIRERLEEVLASDPQFRRTWEHDRPDLGDQSLSTYDLSLLSQAVLVHGWFDPTDLYLLVRLHREEHGDPDKKSKRWDYVRQTIGKALAGVDHGDEEEPDSKVLIRIRPGGLASATRKAAAVIGRATRANPFDGVYRYGDLLVQVTRPSGDPKLHGYGGHGPCGAPMITRADQDALEHTLEEVCRFVRYVRSEDRWVPRDVPPKVARRLLANAARWSEIPILTGIVEASTLRPDGTVLDHPGYDPQTGLLFDSGGVEFPAVPESPTREDALAALKKLTDLLCGFPFVDQASLSVAVSAIITTLLRHACRAVPLHAITAPKMASGKTLLATIVSYVLTGRPPRLMTQAESYAEDRKRLLAVLLEGASLVVIDNVERELSSDALCTVLTEPYFSDRLLGVNKTVTVPSRATFFATGNNLVLVGDLTTRAVVCALDPGCERPEERIFDVNLHEEVPKRRVELVLAALTIVLAYLAASMPKQNVPHFARFEDWCNFVRYPLIWLGMADPCQGRERIEGRDPVREQLLGLLTTCHEILDSEAFKVADLINRASELDAPTSDLELRRALYEVLAEIGGRNGKMSPTAIGKFIASHEHRIEGGLRFEKAGKAKGALLWRVAVMDDHSQVSGKGEVGEVGEVVPGSPGKDSGEEAIVSIKHFGKCKLITKQKVGKKPSAGIGKPNGGNAPHQGHHPHPMALDVNGPDEAASNSGSGQPGGDAPASPSVDPVKSATGGEPIDYGKDLQGTGSGVRP